MSDRLTASLSHNHSFTWSTRPDCELQLCSDWLTVCVWSRPVSPPDIHTFRAPDWSHNPLLEVFLLNKVVRTLTLVLSRCQTAAAVRSHSAKISDIIIERPPNRTGTEKEMWKFPKYTNNSMQLYLLGHRVIKKPHKAVECLLEQLHVWWQIPVRRSAAVCCCGSTFAKLLRFKGVEPHLQFVEEAWI